MESCQNAQPTYFFKYAINKKNYSKVETFNDKQKKKIDKYYEKKIFFAMNENWNDNEKIRLLQIIQQCCTHIERFDCLNHKRLPWKKKLEKYWKLN